MIKTPPLSPCNSRAVDSRVMLAGFRLQYDRLRREGFSEAEATRLARKAAGQYRRRAALYMSVPERVFDESHAAFLSENWGVL